MPNAPQSAARGVIFNTSSGGRFDVVVYDSGLLPGYYDGLRGSRLGAISNHGPTATVAVTSRMGARANATFVDAAGEWRLVIGIE
jgi:hypothetical protein